MAPSPSRPLVLTSVLLAGLIGFWSRAGIGVDLTLWLAWIAVWSVPAGWLLGSARVSVPLAILVPGGWFACAWLLRADLRAAPELHWAALASGGLTAVGFAAGASTGSRTGPFTGAITGAGASLALLAFLCWLPSVGGLRHGPPWSPDVAARLLDLSPASLLIECAGIDWMRHPAVYEPVGADAIGPDSRLPWRGELAGPVVLLVGCLLVLAARRADWKTQCPPASSSAPSPRT